jgi:hypothetical protein
MQNAVKPSESAKVENAGDTGRQRDRERETEGGRSPLKKTAITLKANRGGTAGIDILLSIWGLCDSNMYEICRGGEVGYPRRYSP